MNAEIHSIIKDITNRIVTRFKPEKIILFGSYARGTAGPDSDADLLVVIRVKGRKREQAIQIDQALEGIALPNDVIVVTPEEVERYRASIGSIIRETLREGLVLYEHAA
ncbi:nucleotidyltransferase domain-containing protein [Candidatus Sumerlaeota bacterium]|nr:nucleotidyltransferase domain-containing protein [Candidatus Sumerlaeota bacterium]